MTAPSDSELKFEIGHVLLIDIVGYSKLLINEQRERLQELNELVRTTEPFRAAQASGMLLRIPTGDGVALVFRDSPEPPVRCALEVSQALKSCPGLRVRMGIHSGPVSEIEDVDDRTNIAGGGINMAQRVMDCGDAGHILLSKRVANDLAEYRHWNASLHDLGECEVKHGVRLGIVNLYTDTAGNPEVPEKLARIRAAQSVNTIEAKDGISAGGLKLVLIVGALTLAAALGFWMFRTGQLSKDTSVASAWPATTRASVAEKSIAVLPFENLSRDPDNAYFADGIQEEILIRLSKIRDLKVISRTSTQRYKSAGDNLPEIAKRLGVAHVLEGAVRKADDRVRVTVQLINAETDSHLWSEKYDRELTDIFAVETEIATNIAAALQAKLSGDEQHALSARPTQNPEAHQSYLKGRFYWNKRSEEGLKRAIEYFEHAIQADPNYAPAYAGMAESYALLGFHGYGALPPAEAVPKAKAAAEKALQIDETLAQAHVALAFARGEYDWDVAGAEKGYRRAIELDPNYATAHQWYAMQLAFSGRFPEAIAEIRRAQELDPLSLIINMNVGWVFYYARQYGEAVEQCRKTLELDSNFALTHWLLGQAYREKKMHEEAIAEFEKAVALSGRDPIQIAILGHGYAVAGRSAEARKVIGELEELSKQRYFPPYFIALIYTGLGEKDAAFAWLEKVFTERSADLTVLKAEPMFDPLRSDPRFQDLLRRVGLPR